MARLGGLSQREVAILITASDQASATVNRVAGGLNNLGLAGNNASLRMFGLSHVFSEVGQSLQRFGMLVTGAAIATFKMASDFDRDMRLVQTQADVSGRELESLGDTAKDVSGDLGVPIAELTEGLFDIFSTVDVTVPQAEGLLRKFTKSAVAGFTDVRTAGRSAMAMMNAFDIPAKRVNRVLDAQFTLVKRGAGTYEEFATAIGMGAASADNAGQELETYTAMIAFLTRRGLSASEAVTAAARALDQIARPDRAKDMEKALGIDIIDKASGEYRDMVDIIRDLHEKFEGLTKPEISKKLEKVFGVGEIRAMRFFNAAIPGFERFSKEVRIAQEQAYGFADALKEMRNAPFMQLNRLRESVHVLGIEFGEALVPTFMEFTKIGQGVVEWTDNLSDGTKRLVGQVGALVGVMSLVIGSSMKWVSNYLMMVSITRLAGISFGNALGMISRFAGGMLLLTSLTLEMSGAFDGTNASILRTVNTLGLAGGAFLLIRKVVPMVASGLQTLALKFMYAWDAMKNFFSGASGGGSALSGMMTPMNGITAALSILAIGFILTQRKAAELRQQVAELSEGMLKGTVNITAMGDELRRNLSGSDNWWGMVDARFELERFGQAFDDSIVKIQEERTALAASGVELGRFTNKLINARIASGDLSGAMQLVSQASQIYQSSIDAAGASLDDFSGKQNVSAREVLNSVNKQMIGLEDYSRNWTQLLERDPPKALVEKLQQMGPQAAALLERLVSMTGNKFEEFSRSFEKGRKAVEDTEGKIEDYIGTVNSIPPAKNTNITVRGIETASGQIRDYIALVNSIPSDPTGKGDGGFSGGDGSGSGGTGGGAGSGDTVGDVDGSGFGTPIVTGFGRYQKSSSLSQTDIDGIATAFARALEDKSTGDTVVNINSRKANIDAKDVRDELAWAYRTRGY